MNYNAMMIIPLWEFNGGDHAQNSRAERKKTTYLLSLWGKNGHGVTFKFHRIQWRRSCAKQLCRKKENNIFVVTMGKKWQWSQI